MDRSELSIGITGSHGFIGSHLVESLKSSGKYDLTLLDRNHSNLLDKESLRTFVSGRDVIFHIAGANRDTNINIYEVNVSGTLNLLEAIKHYGSKKVKFIYISSIQVYSPSFNKIAIKENDQQYFPSTIFGISKITAEKLIDLYDIDSIIFRLSNTYGPNSRPFYNSVVATFCYLIADNKSIQINGDGEQKREFVFISDVIAGLIKAISYEGIQREIFNMGSGKLTSLNQIIKFIKAVSEKDVAIEYSLDKNKITGLVLTDQSKIKKKLKWEPKVNLEEGLKETYRYFKNSVNREK